METIYHLTSNGWKETWPAGDRVETWCVQAQQIGGARIVRWARIWHSERWSFEDRKSLHKEYGQPPIVDVGMGLVVCISVAKGCPADQYGFRPFVCGNSGRGIL